MSNKSILIMLHCEQHTGYAIASLEKAFKSAALLAGYEEGNILWSFSKVSVPGPRIFEIGYYSQNDASKLKRIISTYSIDTLLAFDLPYPTPIAKQAHKLGIKNIVSYWGASMSSINYGLRRSVKKLEWYLRQHSAPTKFIFESEAMRLTGTLGRGIPRKKTFLIPLGVDTEVFYPNPDSRYAHDQLNIPRDRKIIFFSGHMEERKGVRVLIETMKLLSDRGDVHRFHLLICGNKNDESKPFESMLEKSEAKYHVTFAGYRNDIPELMRSAFIGAIASTGWDSFTMSSIEMLASGLPIVVSELQGLKETIDPGVCGEYIKPGDAEGLASHILCYEKDTNKYNKHREAARWRATTFFSNDVQAQRISNHLSSGQVTIHAENTKAELNESYAQKGHL